MENYVHQIPLDGQLVIVIINANNKWMQVMTSKWFSFCTSHDVSWIAWAFLVVIMSVNETCIWCKHNHNRFWFRVCFDGWFLTTLALDDGVLAHGKLSRTFQYSSLWQWIPVDTVRCTWQTKTRDIESIADQHQLSQFGHFSGWISSNFQESMRWCKHTYAITDEHEGKHGNE